MHIVFVWNNFSIICFRSTLILSFFYYFQYIEKEILRKICVSRDCFFSLNLSQICNNLLRFIICSDIIRSIKVSNNRILDITNFAVLIYVRVSAKFD